MKWIMSLILLSFSTQIFSIEREVVTRNEKDKLVIVKKELKDLLSDTHFEGKHFKIVYKTTDETIAIDDSLLARRASNVYYHLTIAKKYFERLGFKQDGQMIIRLDIENAYHKRYHFQNAKLNPIFNNASTVAAGAGVESLGIPAWGHEIWFRPVKKEKISKEDKKRFRKLVRSSIPKTSEVNADVIAYTAANAAISEDFKGSLEQSAKTLYQNYFLSAALRYGTPELLLLFSSKNFYFDAAFVPEVIYHEYTHYVMAEFVPPIDNTSIMEGFADFFAVLVSGRTKIAHKLGDYGSLVGSRNALAKKPYSRIIDTKAGLGTEFVMSLLFEVHGMLVKKVGREQANKKILKLTEYITLDTKIRDDFPEIFKKGLPDYWLEAIIILNNRGI